MLSKNKTNGSGYIVFYSHADKKNIYVHRIVATLFIPNHNNYKEVNHIDGDKSNNDISNLEWCSHSMNGLHAYKIGLRKPSIKNAIISCAKSNRKIILDYSNGIYYESMTEVSILFNIPMWKLSNILLGKRKNETTFKYV